MKVTQRTLLIIAAFVWYAGGIALMFKGSALIRSAHLDGPTIFLGIWLRAGRHHFRLSQGEVSLQQSLQ